MKRHSSRLHYQLHRHLMTLMFMSRHVNVTVGFHACVHVCLDAKYCSTKHTNWQFIHMAEVVVILQIAPLFVFSDISLS